MMKNLIMFGIGVCMLLGMVACKSSESAYKKAYEKAKQQELAEPASETVAVTEVTPVVSTPVVDNKPEEVEKAVVKQEKVTVVSGDLNDFSVVVGSFGLKANAEGLKDWLESEGYKATIAFNSEKAMYRVIVATFADKSSAAQARDTFKAKYPDRKDFQGAWLLYRIK